MYQVWVAYRVAVAQLNRYHSGRPDDNSCRKLQEGRGQNETLEHIFWSYPFAQACWQQLLSQWTGEQWTGKDIECFITNCASRTAPALAKGMEDNITQDHPDDKPQYVAIWKRIWHILSSICITTLWIRRNRGVFQQEEVTFEGSVQEFWATGMRQFTALAKRERRSADQVIRGTRLSACQQALEEQAQQQSPQTTSSVQPPDLMETPALLTRLRKYQTSRN